MKTMYYIDYATIPSPWSKPRLAVPKDTSLTFAQVLDEKEAERVKRARKFTTAEAAEKFLAGKIQYAQQLRDFCRFPSNLTNAEEKLYHWYPDPNESREAKIAKWESTDFWLIERQGRLDRLLASRVVSVMVDA